jgi:3-dehydroquinate synthase II
MVTAPIKEKDYMEITKIHRIGEGMRVCIDFVDLLGRNDGLFVGNTGHGYINVLSENRQSKGYPPRPFRINCGASTSTYFKRKRPNICMKSSLVKKLRFRRRLQK